MQAIISSPNLSMPIISNTKIKSAKKVNTTSIIYSATNLILPMPKMSYIEFSFDDLR